MRRAARIHAAIELLDEIEQSLSTGGLAADRLIDAYFRSRRYAGAGDRRETIRLVYAAVRNRGRLLWSLGLKSDARPPARQLMLALLTAIENEKAASLAADFSGGKFAPAPLSAAERRLIDRLAEPPDAPPPEWARWNVPEWLIAPLEESFGDRIGDELEGLEGRATLDIRVNTLKSDRETVLSALARDGIDASACPMSPQGIRLPEGTRVTELDLYRAGLVEIQDEAAQVAAFLADARRGMVVIDLCAGAGGKTLAMAARMANNGTIHAYDVDPGRLQELEKRAKRAGATVAFPRVMPEGEERARILGEFRFGADRVVVDAPCSGTGTWRRNPEARWRLTQERLAGHRELQRKLLDEAAALVKPGGRLVYMTCSILRAENTANAETFLDAHPNFRALDYRDIWRQAIGENPAETAGPPEPYLTLTPALHGTDGFFTAIFERRAG